MTAIVGIDPGFASCGWAVLELHADHEVVRRAGVIRTEASGKKRRVRRIDDDLERVQQIARGLGDLLSESPSRPVACCVEAPEGSRGARQSKAMGLAMGIVATMATTHGVPLLQVSATELKAHVAGSKTAAKDAIRSALEARYGELPIDADVPAGQRDHAVDAVGAVVACLNDEAIRLMRRAAG